MLDKNYSEQSCGCKTTNKYYKSPYDKPSIRREGCWQGGYTEDKDRLQEILGGSLIPIRGGMHDKYKSYEDFTIVYDEDTLVAYLSKQAVPKGIEITNRDYWQPMNITGYEDDNIIILNDKNQAGIVISWTLETAVKSVEQVARKNGAILSFFSREGTPHWEIWQYQHIDPVHWEELKYWKTFTDVYSKFGGWYNSLDELDKVNLGDITDKYVFIGDKLTNSYIYKGTSQGWIETGLKIYQKLMNDLASKNAFSLTATQAKRIRDVLNVDITQDIDEVIQQKLNENFYTFNYNISSEKYNKNKKFSDYTVGTISSSVYTLLKDAIIDKKVIIAKGPTRGRIASSDYKSNSGTIYLQYVITGNNENIENSIIDPIPNNLVFVRIIIDPYDSNGNFIGQYIVVSYNFNDICNAIGNKSNAVAVLDAAAKLPYSLLYPENTGFYETAYGIDRFCYLTQGTYRYITNTPAYVTMKWEDNDTNSRIKNSNYEFKTYVDVYLNNYAINNLILPDNVIWANDDSPTQVGRYRIEIFNNIATYIKIADDPIVHNLRIQIKNYTTYNKLPQDANGNKYLTAKYIDMDGNMVTKQLPIKNVVDPGQATPTNYAYQFLLKYNSVDFDNDSPSEIFSELSDLDINAAYAHYSGNTYLLNLS